ncbi:MAG TPA: FHA domain-containing protein [Polyangia bacterium]|nr:FHA domain-containing protein [Polyangia bacterium]
MIRLSAPRETESPPEPPSPERAFLLAYPRMAKVAQAGEATPAVVVAATRQDEIIGCCRVEAGQALIIGRHTQCGLRLDARSVSLRHLAVLVTTEPGREQPTVRLWDLNTQQPFRTEDGVANAAVMADGPIYFSLDEYGIWLVPARGIAVPSPDAAPDALPSAGWPMSAAEVWSLMPERQFLQRQTPAEPATNPAAPANLHPATRNMSQTTITALGPALSLGAEDDAVPWGEIRLAVGARKERRRVSAERLAQGILIGRYDRCALPLDGEAHELSRVHMLMVRIGDAVWAIDTASTNGVWRGEDPLVADRLGDNETLDLGTVATLTWKRLRENLG